MNPNSYTYTPHPNDVSHEMSLSEILEKTLAFSAGAMDDAKALWCVLTGQQFQPATEANPNVGQEDKGPYDVKRTLAIIAYRLENARNVLQDAIRVLYAELDKRPLVAMKQ